MFVLMRQLDDSSCFLLEPPCQWSMPGGPQLHQPAWPVKKGAAKLKEKTGKSRLHRWSVVIESLSVSATALQPGTSQRIECGDASSKRHKEEERPHIQLVAKLAVEDAGTPRGRKEKDKDRKEKSQPGLPKPQEQWQLLKRIAQLTIVLSRGVAEIMGIFTKTFTVAEP